MLTLPTWASIEGGTATGQSLVLCPYKPVVKLQSPNQRLKAHSYYDTCGMPEGIP
jgi:hypothetical protein